MKKQILMAIATTITLGLSSANALEMVTGTSGLKCNGKFSFSQYKNARFDAIASNPDFADSSSTSKAYRKFASKRKTVLGTAVVGTAANGAAVLVDVTSEVVNFTAAEITEIVSLVPGGLQQIANGDVSGLIGFVAHKGKNMIHIGLRAAGGVTSLILTDLVPAIGNNTLGASAKFLRSQGKGWTWAAELLDGANMVLHKVSKAGNNLILTAALVGIVVTHELACAIGGIAKAIFKDGGKNLRNGMKGLKKGFIENGKRVEKQRREQEDRDRYGSGR